MTATRELLERVTRVRGIRASMLVSAEDGLVVSEALMEGVDGRAVAALAASVAARLRRAVESAGLRAPVFVQLEAARGSVLAAPAGTDLLVVAVADRETDIGLARLELLDVARGLA
jgi:predicted regulator of Ras-like GTPase activity (Roadblock/LC7/MglB family)